VEGLLMQNRPAENEYYEYYSRYIDQVPDGNVLEIIEEQIADTVGLLETIGEEKAGYRYAPEKWSIKQVIGHLIDTERVFQYRSLVFARNDLARLPSMEQDDYVSAANFDDRTMTDLIEEYRATRLAGLALFRSFDSDILMRKGVASDFEFSVRSVPYILAGHSIHHIDVIKDRYL
jgi:hypothetical protein